MVPNSLKQNKIYAVGRVFRKHLCSSRVQKQIDGMEKQNFKSYYCKTLHSILKKKRKKFVMGLFKKTARKAMQ